MTTYRHTESGVEIITESELSGDWELIEESTETTKKTESGEEKPEE